MLQIGINGIGGKMGKAVLDVLLERNHSLTAAFESESYPDIGKEARFLVPGGGLVLKGAAQKGILNVKINPINKNDLKSVHGIIDFSIPKATLKLLEIIKEIKKPIVIGTTGFTDQEKKKIKDASDYAPVLFSPNMSLGINLLFKLTETAAKVLGNDFDIEVFEAHHRFKVDAPSGTAKKLLDIIKSAVSSLNKAPLIYDRSVKKEKRSNKEIGVQVMRGGDIMGEHTVYFAGIGERLELTHRLSSRETLARGAIAALEFLVSRDPGLYDMNDVLGL